MVLGSILFVVSAGMAEHAIEILKKLTAGGNAAIIGTIQNGVPGKIVLQAEMETLRTLGIPAIDPLFMIC